MYTADCRFGGVLGGTAAPVVFMSPQVSPQTVSLALTLAILDRDRALQSLMQYTDSLDALPPGAGIKPLCDQPCEHYPRVISGKPCLIFRVRYHRCPRNYRNYHRSTRPDALRNRSDLAPRNSGKENRYNRETFQMEPCG